MKRPSQAPIAHLAPAGHDDLLRILGEVDDARALEILALEPSVAELEEAALWAAGEGNRLDRGGHPLVGKAADIFEILARDEETPEPPR